MAFRTVTIRNHMALGLCLGSMLFGFGRDGRAADTTLFFEKDIQPLFEKHCVECHGADVKKADLDLRSLTASLRGGETGEVIIPGDAHHSSLFEKVKSGEMPPKARTKFNETELHILEKWINAGAHGLKTDNTPLLSSVEKIARKACDVIELKCLPCHSEKKQEGNLDLRTVASMLKGGKNGPAAIKGDAEKSLIIKKISEDAMPPRELRNMASIKPVTAAELEILKNWINAGIVEPMPLPVLAEDDFQQITEQERSWWAFQPPKQTSIPKVRDQRRVRTPVDTFLLKKLEDAKSSSDRKAKLSFSPDAPARTLVRRVYFAVTGLPPTPEQVEEFLRDKKSGAYERLVDQLLASPRYGERWGQFWLDAAGYADSEGAIDDDPILDEYWRYRDYVIRSLNEDKPYDRFLMEQIAGDELADYRNAKEFTPEFADNLIATGFLRGGIDPTMSPAVNFPPDRHQVIADKLEMVGSTLFGLTLHCARCHSHKYDPISQRDYYRLGAIFAGAYSPMEWKTPPDRYIPLATTALQEEVKKHNAEIDAEKKKLEQPQEALRTKYKFQLFEQKTASLPEDIRKLLRELIPIPTEKRTEPQKELALKYAEQLKLEDRHLVAAFADYKAHFDNFTNAVAKAEAKRRKLDRAFALTDIRPDPKPFYLHRRGDPFDRVAEVRPQIPAVLANEKNPFAVKIPFPGANTSGRRLAFARWLTHPENPLTARVIVNRVWQHYFGKGIVETVENFGHTGSPPTHPELLDWLAVEFVKDGWRLKKLHRLILTSTVFRQQSRTTETGLSIDPENKWLWRMPLQRLDAESIRDAVLVCSGTLQFEMFGPPSPIDVKADGQVVANNSSGHTRRSIYTLHRRLKPMTLLETFDAPQSSVNCTRRRLSNVVSQPLLMLNSEFMAEQARRLSERVEPLPSSLAKVDRLYQLLFSRAPSKQEKHLALKFLSEQSAAYQSAIPETETAVNKPEAGASPETNEDETFAKEALIDLCLVLFNSAEFIYVD